MISSSVAAPAASCFATQLPQIVFEQAHIFSADDLLRPIRRMIAQTGRYWAKPVLIGELAQLGKHWRSQWHPMVGFLFYFADF